MRLLTLVSLVVALPACLASVPSHAYDQLLTKAQVNSCRQAPRKRPCQLPPTSRRRHARHPTLPTTWSRGLLNRENTLYAILHAIPSQPCPSMHAGCASASA
jgi:hypothetical protein